MTSVFWRARPQTIVWAAVLMMLLAGASQLSGATFGTVIPIGGQASDIALDEGRRALYIANFTGNRIDVMSLDTNALVRSIQVNPQPGALAVSRDGKFLLIAHYGNFEPSRNSMTVLNLTDNSRRVFALGAAPLSIAFGLDDQAFVVTANEFLLLDPASGQTRTIDTVAGLAGKTLPVPVPSLPAEIIRASVGASKDGLWIYGLTDKFLFRYDIRLRQLIITGYTSTPEMGPRTVSVSPDGSYYTAGWALFDRQGSMMAQFPNPAGKLNIGSHALDLEGGIVYAQLTEGESAPSPSTTCKTTTTANGSITVCTSPEGTTTSCATTVTPTSSTTVCTPTTPTIQINADPVLELLAADNLAVIERLQLRENLTGRAVLNSSRDVVYVVSASGVTVLPVGQRTKARRVKFEKQDLVFRGSACARQEYTQEVAVVDMGGNRTSFRLVPRKGVTVSPDSGVTPAVVSVTIDPGAFISAKGTSVAYIELRSDEAVNIAHPLRDAGVPVPTDGIRVSEPADRIRVLVNYREPDQRGLVQTLPGKLVDVLADPVRNRFMVLRQDTNEVLVFDKNLRRIATLRTGNTPTQIAISPELKYLIIGNDNSQVASVFDLDTLEASAPIRFPFGHYPRSIAVSGNAILASVRSAGGTHTIDRIDMATRTAWTPSSLGVYKNDVHIDTALAASPDGSSILIVMGDGRVMLYDANADSFVGRKDFPKLSGAYAASSYDVFVVDNTLLNSSLVPVGSLDKTSGSSSGFVFVDRVGFRSTTPGASQAGMMARVNLSQMQSILPTRLTESPLTADTEPAGFTRTLAVLGNREGLISLTTSGFTVLPWNYDASYAPPRIDRVVSAADLSANVAPGSLITIFGAQLSPAPGVATDPATADVLAESCLTVNGSVAPVVFSSPDKINAQVPWNAGGTANLILRTPGGASDSYRLRIAPGAPSVFRSGTAGPETGIPTIVRSVNNQLVTVSNPVHAGDDLVIYATGLGRTDPEVPVGTPSPFEPLARALETPKITLGNVTLPVYFAGLTPGLIGVYQINVIVPRSVPIGFDIPLRIEQDATETTIPVRVLP